MICRRGAAVEWATGFKRRSTTQTFHIQSPWDKSHGYHRGIAARFYSQKQPRTTRTTRKDRRGTQIEMQLRLFPTVRVFGVFRG